MNPDEFVSITRGLVKRGWSEIEPKVAASFVTGGVSGIFLAILTSYHVPITPALAQWAPYIFAVIGGYVFPSSGQVIVTKADPASHTTTTKTVGAVQTVVTGAIPVQKPEPPKQAPNVPLSELLKPTGPTAVPDIQPVAPNPTASPNVNNAETQVMYK
jgi:hypothetical protein